MASEKAMWQTLRPLMKGLDPIRVENVVYPGTPDVNYSRGWIELKYLPRWPVRGGVVKVDHFTTQQRVWLTRRCAAGGKAFLLLKVGESDWLLFIGSVAAAIVGKVTQKQLYYYALTSWTNTPTPQELQSCL